MINFFKKIFGSRLFKLFGSTVLMYLAFRKVDLTTLAVLLLKVPWWFWVAMLAYQIVLVIIGAYRWSLLLFDKPGVDEVKNFTRASMLGSFYGLLFPTMVASDLLKWLSILKKYPEITKTKLLSSVFLDRVVGFTIFIFSAFLASLVALMTGVAIPWFLVWIFGGLFLGVLVFYFLVFKINLEKIFERFSWLKKGGDIVELIKNENKSRIYRALGVSLVTELMWVMQVYFISEIFEAGFSLLSVLVVVPVVSMVLLLPISIGGIGARDSMYLVFFGNLGYEPAKILAVSAFSGILGILGSLINGFANYF